MRWLILQPKYRLFEMHHARLLAAPDPQAASEKFAHRLRSMKRTYSIRTACYVGLYFTFVATVAGFILSRVPAVGTIRSLIEIVAGIASSLTVLFLAGIFIANRYLGLLEVELTFYSAEARTPSSPRA